MTNIIISARQILANPDGTPTSFDMLPRKPLTYFANITLGNAKVFGNGSNRSSVGVNNWNIGFGDLCSVMLGTMLHFLTMFPRSVFITRSASSFARHVPSVVAARSKEKVRRLYTCPIVAAVKDAKTIRNWSIYLRPHFSVRSYFGSSKFKHPIAVFFSVPIPFSTAAIHYRAALEHKLKKFFQDTSTKVNDVLRVRFVVANRRSWALVPAL